MLQLYLTIWRIWSKVALVRVWSRRHYERCMPHQPYCPLAQ